MSTVPYEPKPGTTAYRALAHLQTQPAGTELSTARFAEAIGVPANNLLPCLMAAEKASAIHRRQKDTSHPRAPFFWSLTPHAVGTQPAAQVPADEPAAAPARRRALAEVEKQEVTREPVPATGMRLALWSNGVLEVRRNPDDLILFTVDETRQIVRYLDRLGFEA